MSTSELYTFGSPKSKDIIEDAYERCGITPSELTQQQIKSAQRSANLILQSWINKGNNLWTIRIGMIGLNTNQNAYRLPVGAVDLKTVMIRTSNRVLGGVPFSSSGGIASLAFDNNSATACSQIAADGYISYSYSNGFNSISMVGIQVNKTSVYGFVVEYSNDNVNWFEALNIIPQTYIERQISWFAIPVPTPAKIYRLRQTSSSALFWKNISFALWSELTITPWKDFDAIPLNVQELFFSNMLNDVNISRLGENEYNLLPNKLQTSRPSSFWVDRQINPVVYLWPTPNSLYNCLYFSYWRAIQNIGDLNNTPEVPARFLEALTTALAAKLAIKEKAFDLLPVLKTEAAEAYNEAGDEDSERVSLRIYPDFMGYS